MRHQFLKENTTVWIWLIGQLVGWSVIELVNQLASNLEYPMRINQEMEVKTPEVTNYQ